MFIFIFCELYFKSTKKVRDKLYPLNKETFESIETALFTISLDHDAPTSEDQVCFYFSILLSKNNINKNKNEKTAEFLMVAGPNSTGNRWYDKLSHWIVFENGRAGFNGEVLFFNNINNN